MRFAAVVLLIVSLVGLLAALLTGSPTPSNPRHGTFGVSGLDGSFIAWACVGMCAIGLVLLFIDARLERRRPPLPEGRATRQVTSFSASTTSNAI